MFGPYSTAGKIDEFEIRFTQVNGGHFLITRNGEEAWPISAAEVAEFKGLYRRRMEWARWLRRLSIVLPFALLIFTPPPLRRIVFHFGAAPWLLLIPLGYIMHPLVSDLTKAGIERSLGRRITTRIPAAITPGLTRLGRFGRQLFFACLAIEIGMQIMPFLAGREFHAEHLRVLTWMANGQEGLLAQLSGNLGRIARIFMIFALIMIAWDRRYRRDAAVEAEAGAAIAKQDSAREQLLRQLADEHRAALPAAAGAERAGHPRSATFGRNVRTDPRHGDGPGNPVSR